MAIGPSGSMAIYSGPVMASADGTRPISTRSNAARFGAEPVKAVIRDAAQRQQLSEALVEAVAWQESRMQQSAVSPKGARGVMQLMPATARALGVDAANLSGNINGGTAYLAQMMQRFDGDVINALAAYNAGPDVVARYGGVPPYRETQNYVDAILGRMAESGTHALEVQP